MPEGFALVPGGELYYEESDEGLAVLTTGAQMRHSAILR